MVKEGKQTEGCCEHTWRRRRRKDEVILEFKPTNSLKSCSSAQLLHPASFSSHLPAETSAFMFFSKSQVTLPRASLTEPGAKAALSPASTQARSPRTHAITQASPLRPAYPPTHCLHAHTHTITHNRTHFDCLHAVAVIKTH